MSVLEMDQAISQLQVYRDYELTNLLYSEKALQLSFSMDNNYCWLTFSLKPQTFFFLGDSKTKLIKGFKKPLVLFFQSHLKGRNIYSIERVQEEGRVVRLNLSEDKRFHLKIFLFPGGQNIFLQAGDKSIKAFKPREVGVHKLDENFKSEEEIRSPQFFSEYWEKQESVRKASAEKSEDRDLKKVLKKKERGLNKMLQSLEDLKSTPWQEVGEWLKTQGDYSQVPAHWGNFIDQAQDLSWNIENCFFQMKKTKQKEEGTKERLEILEKEIEQLKKGQWKKPTSAGKSLMQASEAKGRTRKLSDGSSFYIGKSGKDNLALLRRAKPWFLWLHIRDYPGAHGILERNKKSKEPSLKILQEAAREVLQQTVKGKPEGPYEVLIAECRYVRPIKGGKPGQVTHSHEKVLKITL